jgi:cytochrome c oxidase subunit 2
MAIGPEGEFACAGGTKWGMLRKRAYYELEGATVRIFLRTISLLAVTAVFATGSFSSAAKRVGQQTATQTSAQNGNVQVINMTAKKYVFSPSPIHVKKGTRVELRITATDRQHGFKINIYPDGGSTKGAPGLEFAAPKDCWTLPKGQTVTIDLVARTPGHYPFKCCKFCGFGHMGMKGELIVDE